MYLAELEEAVPVLPSPSLGLPQAPPPAPADFRGVAIHWLGSALPTEKPGIRVAPTVPVPIWNWMGVDFAVLSPERADRPPATTVEREAYVRHAAAIVMNQQALSPQATLLWEVRDLRITSAAFRVRTRWLVTAPILRHGSAALRVDVQITERLIVKSGSAALRANTGSWVPVVIPQKNGFTACTVRSLSQATMDPPAKTGTAALKAIPMISGVAPPIRVSGSAALRANTGSWVPVVIPQKNGFTACTVRSLSQATMDPPAKTGTVALRVRQW